MINIDEYNKIKSLSDDLLLEWYYQTNESFKKLVNEGNDEKADKMDILNIAIESELLTREHISLELIYKK